MKKSWLLPLVVIAMLLSTFGAAAEAILAPTVRKEEGSYEVISDTMEKGPTGSFAAAFSGGTDESGIALAQKRSQSGFSGLILATMDPLSAVLTTDMMKTTDSGGTLQEKLLADPRMGNMSDVESTNEMKTDPYAQLARGYNYDVDADAPGPGIPAEMEALEQLQFNP